MSEEREIPEIKFNKDDLYREESITDRRSGVIRCLIPVKADGSDDDSRAKVYEGQTTILTPMGSLPVNFEIEAGNLQEAVEGFPEAARKGIAETLEELKRLQREAQSSIVVPGRGGTGGPGGGNVPGGGGLPGGGAPGGGIQMP